MSFLRGLNRASIWHKNQETIIITKQTRQKKATNLTKTNIPCKGHYVSIFKKCGKHSLSVFHISLGETYGSAVNNKSIFIKQILTINLP